MKSKEEFEFLLDKEKGKSDNLQKSVDTNNISKIIPKINQNKFSKRDEIWEAKRKEREYLFASVNSNLLPKKEEKTNLENYQDYISKPALNKNFSTPENQAKFTNSNNNAQLPYSNNSVDKVSQNSPSKSPSTVVRIESTFMPPLNTNTKLGKNSKIITPNINAFKYQYLNELKASALERQATMKKTKLKEIEEERKLLDQFNSLYPYGKGIPPICGSFEHVNEIRRKSKNELNLNVSVDNSSKKVKNLNQQYQNNPVMNYNIYQKFQKHKNTCPPIEIIDPQFINYTSNKNNESLKQQYSHKIINSKNKNDNEQNKEVLHVINRLETPREITLNTQTNSKVLIEDQKNSENKQEIKIEYSKLQNSEDSNENAFKNRNKKINQFENQQEDKERQKKELLRKELSNQIEMKRKLKDMEKEKKRLEDQIEEEKVKKERIALEE